MTVAVFPGSFDPITLGHVDLVRRGAQLFEKLVVGVGVNPAKSPLFPVEERVAMVRSAVAGAGVENVAVESFAGLVVDFARSVGARCILRGLRGAADADYERPMAMTNATLAPEVETVFLLPSADVSFIASRLVREVAAAGRSVDHLVPAEVARLLAARLKHERPAP